MLSLIPQEIKMLNRRDSFKFLAAAMAAGVTGVPAFSQAAESVEKAPAGPDFPTEKDHWTMVIVPDTQSYVKYGRNQGILELMTAWIQENAQKFRIQQVLVAGDLVEQNNANRGSRYNQTSEQQWSAVSDAFKRLDGVLPYVVCTGNHDHGFYSAENRETNLSKYFFPERNPSWNGVLVEMGLNTFGQKTLENAAFEFTTPAGQKMLTISLPFAPTDENLAWAKELAARPKYENHFVTVLTHSFMDGNAQRIVSEGYQLNKEGGNAGEAIWQKLVKPSKNIRLVVCGHRSGADNWPECTSFRKDKNDAGKDVAQILFDTQALGGGWNGNGGDGWIRLLEFSADLKTVKARTLSPLFDIIPGYRHMAWERSERNEFTFTMD